MYMYLNGQFMKETEAMISVFDHGFLYGMGLFETFRTYGGRPFLLEEHLERLEEGCRQIGIRWHADIHKILQAIQQLLNCNQASDAYFRLSVSAGIQPLGLPSETYHQPNLMIYMKFLSQKAEVPKSLMKNLQLLRHRRNTPEGSIRFKSFHYMNNIIAKFELNQYNSKHPTEGVMLTPDLYIAEGIVSNIFFVKKQQLFTPSLETGILPGVTRNCIIKLAKQSNIPVHEGFFGWENLLEADEVFTTNSIQGIEPIGVLLNEQGEAFVLPNPLENAITSKIIHVYSELTVRKSF